MSGKILELWRAMKVQKNWTVQVTEALQWGSKPLIDLKLRNGWTLQARSKSIDRCSFNEVWLDRIYDPEEADIRWEEMKVMVDIGAHIGSATMYVADKAKKAEIFSYEASPENFEILKGNVERNHLEKRIHLFPQAVAGKEGTMKFYLMGSTGGNSLYAYGPAKKMIEVPTVTLSGLFRSNKIEHCDLLKIDCEGAEYDILYNTPDNIFGNITCIILEYHHFMKAENQSPQALEAFLSGKGFTVTYPSKSVMCAKR